MEEVWKDIPNYEGMYQVSNLGNIKNVKKGKIKIPNKNKNGYLYIDLWKDNKNKKMTIHRAVAMAFLSNDNDYTDINHKDGNKTNNIVDNLEWCNRSHNLKEAYRLGLRKPTRAMLGKKGKLCPNSKKIKQYDKLGNLIKIWNSTMDIERELNIIHNNVSSCCLGRLKTYKGFVWRFNDE